jgi:hypothetical protein
MPQNTLRSADLTRSQDIEAGLNRPSFALVAICVKSFLTSSREKTRAEFHVFECCYRDLRDGMIIGGVFFSDDNIF